MVQTPANLDTNHLIEHCIIQDVPKRSCIISFLLKEPRRESDKWPDLISWKLFEKTGEG